MPHPSGGRGTSSIPVKVSNPFSLIETAAPSALEFAVAAPALELDAADPVYNIVLI